MENFTNLSCVHFYHFPADKLAKLKSFEKLSSVRYNVKLTREDFNLIQESDKLAIQKLDIGGSGKFWFYFWMETLRELIAERRPPSWPDELTFGPLRVHDDTSSSSISRPRPITAATVPASYRSPSGPVLRANPFPKVTDLICRPTLPTLFYQLEAIHLGDLLRLWVRFRNSHYPSAEISRKWRSKPTCMNKILNWYGIFLKKIIDFQKQLPKFSKFGCHLASNFGRLNDLGDIEQILTRFTTSEKISGNGLKNIYRFSKMGSLNLRRL